MDIQQVKQRFGIIGNAPALDRALEVAIQVAPTDISVLVTGESGTGKENIPKVIHNLSKRKHAPYIAVNCGAIPEGTIDSELFGHEKGSFTGASAARKGYFEVADGGTIFLDEVAELPLQTQVRLLRVLETGEFIKVGSSKVIKTNVRVVAATNVKMMQAIRDGKFREDLYYRLNTVPVSLPPLRERKEDIYLLFRKFASDFADKFKMPQIQLTPEAIQMISAYDFPGNIRQLKNITEQISVIERERIITPQILSTYLPEIPEMLPAVIPTGEKSNSGSSESYTDRELLYKVLFDLKAEVHDLKLMLSQLGQQQNYTTVPQQPVYQQPTSTPPQIIHTVSPPSGYDDDFHEHEEIQEESLSLEDREKELIRKALQKHKGKRKSAAKELGISERTLYRKIKEFNLHQ